MNKDKFVQKIIKLSMFEPLSDDLLDQVESREKWRVEFPNGIQDVAIFYAQNINEQAVQALGAEKNLRTNEKIIYLIMKRFELMAEDKEFIRKLSAYFASRPQSWGVVVCDFFKNVSEIWDEAGDKSTDYNYYTKRGILASVYAPTILYWLQDESENFADTQDFLKRKIAGVMKFGIVKAKFKGFFGL